MDCTSRTSILYVHTGQYYYYRYYYYTVMNFSNFW